MDKTADLCSNINNPKAKAVLELSSTNFLFPIKPISTCNGAKAQPEIRPLSLKSPAKQEQIVPVINSIHMIFLNFSISSVFSVSVICIKTFHYCRAGNNALITAGNIAQQKRNTRNRSWSLDKVNANNFFSGVAFSFTRHKV